MEVLAVVLSHSSEKHLVAFRNHQRFFSSPCVVHMWPGSEDLAARCIVWFFPLETGPEAIRKTAETVRTLRATGKLTLTSRRLGPLLALSFWCRVLECCLDCLESWHMNQMKKKMNPSRKKWSNHEALPVSRATPGNPTPLNQKIQQDNSI